MASSALNQLIAAQRGPDIAGAIMGGIQAAKQEQAQAQDAELRRQQITMGQRQLAGADAAYADRRMKEVQQRIANVAVQIDKISDPAQRNAFYQQQLRMAQQGGEDVSAFPPEYNDEAQQILDYHKGQVYGGEILKSDLKRAESAAKPSGPSSNVGKLMADRAAAAAAGASAQELAAYDAAIEKAGKSGGPMISVTVGDKQPLTRSNQSKVQDKIMDAEVALSDLESIANKYSGDFLTYGGRAKAALGGVADKMGPLADMVGLDGPITKDAVAFNAQSAAFKNSINQFFNQYRKEITGAAASEKEMQMLMDSMFNKDLGPEAFKSTFEQFKAKAKKNYELNKRAAREGVNVGPSTNSRGWQLHIDADGNQAYVNPENPEEYEEVE